MRAAQPGEKARAFSGDGEKARVGNHAVFGTNAHLGDVPMALQDLNRVDEHELTVARKGVDKLFDLQHGRQITGDISPRLQRLGHTVNDPPGFWEVEDDTVDIVNIEAFINIADPNLQVGRFTHE